MDASPRLVQDRRSVRAKPLKALHVVSTVWFILCLGYVLIMDLHRAGFRWWVIFSLSGHSVVLVLVLVSLYLFALFRGVSQNQQIQLEHPLTTSDYYMTLYTAAPFLGGAAGCLSVVGLDGGAQLIHRLTLGTLVVTFVVWVILDPALALLESFFPDSRKRRDERLSRQEAERQEREARRRQVLVQVHETEQTHRKLWQQVLEPYAQELARLLTAEPGGFPKARARVVEIGAEAWRLGGIGCMRQLREMTISAWRELAASEPSVDYLSHWWDGIGTWRGPNS